MKNQQIYFDTLSAAIETACERATKRGYIVNEDDVFSSFGTGGVGYRETKSASIELSKNGKIQRKALQITIYRMCSGRYELTDYIN